MNIRLKSYKRQRGVVVVEFALGFPAFILMIFLWAEISFLGYASAVLDMATSEAVRRVKSDKFADNAAIKAEIEAVLAQSSSLWSNFIDADNFTFTSCYYHAIADANAGVCSTNSEDNPIAVFQMGYPYQSIYNSLGGTFNLKREMIVILEYERSNI
jgi:tight adherence protein E